LAKVRLAAAVLLLSCLSMSGVAPAEDGGRWLRDLAAAKRRARAERKPVLCVLLRSGHADSRRLERDLGKSRKIVAILDSFVCVKLDYDGQSALVGRYGLRYAPATVYFTMTGAPMKTVVGAISSGKYLAQAKAALEKHATLWRPKVPTRAPPKPRPAGEREVPWVVHAPDCPDGCAPCETAIGKALSWLARKQGSDGRLAKPEKERITKTDDGRTLTRSIDNIEVALTAVGGLAFLAEGSTPSGGKRRKNLARAVEFLTASLRSDGIVSPFSGNDHLYLVTCNFETPLAAMFLSEVHRADPDPKLREALVAIAKYLARAQESRTGAWGYSFDFKEFSPFTRRGWRLLATTQVCLAALNSMREAGVPVDEDVIGRAARYLLLCRTRDGAFSYKAEYRMGKGEPGTAAGAIHALGRSGRVDAATLESIRAGHRRRYARLDGFGKHWWWFLLFSAFAMHDSGAGAYDAFDHSFRDLLLHDQKDDGHWTEPDGNGGSVFATAIAAVVLQLRKGHLSIATARAEPEEIRPAKRPEYIDPPSDLSRVKVFPHGDGYRYDLVVSVDGPADDVYLERLKKGVIMANRTIYDVTDGQMTLNRVEIHAERGRWDEADVMISREFHDADVNPNPWAHGITRVSSRTDVVRGREKKRNPIGDWVMFPYHGKDRQAAIRWDDRRIAHVLAHELCHYLFGAKDEYGTHNGQSYCDCIMGKRRVTELCTEAGHTDDRQDRACWSLAKALYPRLRVPDEPDPGPWDPPVPQAVIVR